jgi:hypothetical protein
VIEKIRSAIHWPQCADDPAAQYRWLLLNPGEYECAYLSQCPEGYEEHKDFWSTTVRTIIRDTEDGEKANLSLGLAIDMLWPCHWGFVSNLRIVLGAIGGNLHPDEPFAACGRNISLVPIRRRMMAVSKTLKVFRGALESNQNVDGDLLALLGRPTDEKKWLASSLDKTISLQLDPPAGLRAISALTGPDWIGQ